MIHAPELFQYPASTGYQKQDISDAYTVHSYFLFFHQVCRGRISSCEEGKDLREYQVGKRDRGRKFFGRKSRFKNEGGEE